MADKREKLLILNTYISNETLLGSWIRNTIILFSFGITVASFSNNIYKNQISLILFAMGLLIGIISVHNYSMIANNFKNGEYKMPSEYTYNIYSIIFILLILVILFTMRLLKYKKK